MAERWVNQTELSEITGFHIKSLQVMYRREPGVLVTRTTEKGTGTKLEYKLPDTIVNLLKREREAGIRKKSKVVDASTKSLSERRLSADTQMAELELYELQGDIIRLDVHERRVDDICARLSAALEVIPSKYLSRIQVARTDLEAQEVGEKIRDDTKAALYSVADDLTDVTNETQQKNEGG